MNKPMVYSSKVCYEREVLQRKKMHRDKMRAMPPTSHTNARGKLDHNPPKTFPHLDMKLKKRQMEEERYFQIEHDNRLLMAKMYSIMNQRPDPKSVEYSPGLRISRKTGAPMLDNYLSTRSVFAGNAVPKPSMNQDARRKEYKRIMEENSQILQRITQRKPTYQRKEWAKDRKEKERYLRTISHDVTAGFLPQGPDGRSIYAAAKPPPGRSPRSSQRLPPLEDEEDRPEWVSGGTSIWSNNPPASPIALDASLRSTGSTSRRRPKTSGSRRGGRRGRSRPGGARGTESQGGARGASGRQQARHPEEPAVLWHGSRPVVLPAEDGEEERKVRCELMVTEVPVFAGSSNEDLQPATSGVNVNAGLDSGEAAQLALTVDNLKEIGRLTHDPVVKTALGRLKLLDARGNFSRMSTAFSGGEMMAVGRAVSRRIEAVVAKDGGLSLAITAEDVDHGEGGVHEWEQDLDKAKASAVKVQSIVRQKTARKLVEQKRVLKKHSEDPASKDAATKLQAAERGRKSRRRVKLMKQQRELGEVLFSKSVRLPDVVPSNDKVFCTVQIFNTAVHATIVATDRLMELPVTDAQGKFAESLEAEHKAMADISGKRTSYGKGAALHSMLSVDTSAGPGKEFLVLSTKR